MSSSDSTATEQAATVDCFGYIRIKDSFFKVNTIDCAVVTHDIVISKHILNLTFQSGKTISYRFKSHVEAVELYNIIWKAITEFYITYELKSNPRSLSPHLFASSPQYQLPSLHIPIQSTHLTESFRLCNQQLEIGPFNPVTFNDPTADEIASSEETHSNP